jgi:hypothetical protein
MKNIMGINYAPNHFISVVDNALVLFGQVSYFTKINWNKNNWQNVGKT